MIGAARWTIIVLQPTFAIHTPALGFFGGGVASTLLSHACSGRGKRFVLNRGVSLHVRLG